MRQYVESASRTPVLGATLVAVLVLLVMVFPALPIGGQLLDVKARYTYAEALAAMESYGERGRQVYAWSSATLDACCRSFASASWPDSSTGSDQRNGSSDWPICRWRRACSICARTFRSSSC